MHTLTVELADRSYPIHIGSGLLRQPELLREALGGGRICVVSNAAVADLYLEPLCQALPEAPDTVLLPEGEQHKNLTTLNTIFDVLLEKNHGRDTTLVALGGGVVGDMTGFAAACYQRGVAFVQVPTTLLAQVDSSVGGKTGVNHALGKNMIGAFHQPRSVLIDTDVLASLPVRELSAGLAEIIKYGLIADVAFFEWLEHNVDKLMQLDADALAYAIRRSCEIKAQVVSEDEREGGRRAILNFGHTFGHAIEAEQGYGRWLHGEAVAAGMVLAARLSAARGGIGSDWVERTRTLLQRAGCPVDPPEGMSADRFNYWMAKDKKVLAGQLRLVLLERPGTAAVVDAQASDIEPLFG